MDAEFSPKPGSNQQHHHPSCTVTSGQRRKEFGVFLRPRLVDGGISPFARHHLFLATRSFFPIESSKLWDGTIRYTPQPFKGLSIERPATHPDSSSSPKQDMPSPRSGVDWPRLTPHSAGTISPRFSPQSLDLGIFCLGSVLPLRCAAFMGPSMSARRLPADKAVMLIGQQRCINGDRPITTDTAAAPEWWLLIASTAAETTTSWYPCSTSSSSNLAVGLLDFPPLALSGLQRPP